MKAFDRAWRLLKEEMTCNFCGKTVGEDEIAASSSQHGPTKPRWEACYQCLKQGKVVDNNGNEVR